MKILCVNHKQFDNNVFYQSMPELRNMVALSWACNHRLIYPRFGRHNLPADSNPLIELFGSPNDVAQTPADGFAEINDRTCDAMIRSKRDRPWILHWSGGIDSTAIVVALLKHPEQQFRENIWISLNELSVFENPRFFYHYIEPNLKVMHGHDPRTKDHANFYHVSGAMADQLCGPGTALEMHGIDGRARLSQSRGRITSQVREIWNIDSNWFYTRMMEHIESVADAPVETCSDFFWWFEFTWPWFALLLHEYNGVEKNMRQYLDCKIHWYGNDQFHAWAWHRAREQYRESFNRPEKFKQEIKNYIWDFDKNNYYRCFKTKAHSDSRSRLPINDMYSKSTGRSWIALDQELNPYFSCDGIEDLLRDHLTQKEKL